MRRGRATSTVALRSGAPPTSKDTHPAASTTGRALLSSHLLAARPSLLECPRMSEPTGEELSNLYMRGVKEGARGEDLDPQEVLDVLDVFGGEGVRTYMVGRLEGIEDETERKLEEYGDIEYDLAFEFHESAFSVLRETEDLLRLRMDDAPADLSAEVDLRIVDDEEDVVQDGRIVVVEFKDADEISESRPAVITIRKRKFEIIEYEDPDWLPEG